MLALITLAALLQTASTHPVNILVAGDSLSRCTQGGPCALMGPTNPANLWVNALTTYLHSNYGDHGDGIKPILLGAGTSADRDAFSWDYYDVSGSFAFVADDGPQQFGPYATFIHTGSLMRFDGSTVVTMHPMLGDTANVYGSGIHVSIDGQVVGTTNGNRTSYPVGFGTHTLSLSGDGGLLYGAEWTKGTTGVSVHNAAVAGVDSVWFGGQPQNYTYWDLIPGGVNGVIAAFGSNDPGNSAPIDASKTNLSNFLSHEIGTGAQAALVINEPYGHFVPAAGLPELPNYWPALSEVADTFSVPHISLSDYWGFQQGIDQGYYNSDQIHLSDAGQLAWASAAEKAINGGEAPGWDYLTGFRPVAPIVSSGSSQVISGDSTKNVWYGTSGHSISAKLAVMTDCQTATDCTTGGYYGGVWALDSNGSAYLLANAGGKIGLLHFTSQNGDYIQQDVPVLRQISSGSPMMRLSLDSGSLTASVSQDAGATWIDVKVVSNLGSPVSVGLQTSPHCILTAKNVSIQ